MIELERFLSILASAGTLLVSAVTLYKVFKIQKQTNHMHNEVVKLTHSAGVIEGRQQMKDEFPDAT